MRGRLAVSIVLFCAVALATGACRSEEATPSTSSIPQQATAPAQASTSSIPPPATTALSTTVESTSVSGVPLARILGPYETRFLEESAGYYSSYRIEPCFAAATGDSIAKQALVGYGTVVECGLTTDPPGDSGELWVVVLDDTGTVATWGGGTGEEAGLISDAPPGLLCREFLAQPTLNSVASQSGTDWPHSSPWAYTAVLAYWFLEGQPARMDVDGNGIPCEVLFDPGVVAEVWAGDTGP